MWSAGRVIGGIAACAVGTTVLFLAPAVANAAPSAPAPQPAPSSPGSHVGQWLNGGTAPSEAQQPRDSAGGWVAHPGETGAQCMDRGVVCDTGIWYPDQVQSQRGQSEWVQMPDMTGADCENPGVICGSTAS